MKRRASLARAGHDPEQGAALILAIGVMMLVGLLSAGLLSYITTSVRGRSGLDVVRNRQYAADAAVEYAISQVRALPDPGPGQASCGGPYSPPAAVNGFSVTVSCSNNSTLAFDQATATFYFQRNVVFTACVGTCASENDVVVRAQVNFEVPPGSTSATRTYVQSWSVNR